MDQRPKLDNQVCRLDAKLVGFGVTWTCFLLRVIRKKYVGNEEGEVGICVGGGHREGLTAS